MKTAVFAVNGNHCANLAEALHGVLSTFERAAYLTVSTGTGAGVCLGHLSDRAFLYLAQIGYHIVYPNGERCGCGQTGCVQTITGGQSIMQHHGVSAVNLQDNHAWEHITETLALAIINLVRITKVDAVCIGGGIGYNAPYIRHHLEQQVRAKAPDLSISLLFPSLGEDAPIIGTMALLHLKQGPTIFH